MSKKTTGLNPGKKTYEAASLQNRIRQFFRNNPDEELSYRDIAVKFSCNVEQAQAAVYELIKRDGKLMTVTTVRVLPEDPELDARAAA
jgi:hypothetical protein